MPDGDKKKKSIPAYKEGSSLAELLQSMYSWFARHLYFQKLASYRSSAPSGMRKSVIRQLQEHINQPKVETPDIHAVDNCPPGQACKPDAGKDLKPDPETISGLGQSFYEHNLNVAYHGMAEKLIKSIWEHLHATVRYSREGDRESAKLHLDILDSALNEVAHFMQEDDYRVLIQDIDKELQSLNKI